MALVARKLMTNDGVRSEDYVVGGEIRLRLYELIGQRVTERSCEIMNDKVLSPIQHM